jgi:TonB family protein
MRRRLFFFISIAFMSSGRMMADDNAERWIADAAQKARAAAIWEAEGVRMIERTDTKTNVPFRVSVENANVSTGRARLEITGGPNPLVRVCDGKKQLTYLVLGKHYWSVVDQGIEACAYPFTEWMNLARDLRSPVIVGKETLALADRIVDCTIVEGEFAAVDSTPGGRRTIWIDDRSKMVWMYRVEGPSLDSSSPGARPIETYSLSWQVQAGVRRSADLWEFQEVDGTSEVPAPADGAELPGQLGPSILVDLPKSLYRIGGKVKPPSLVYKVEPVYTEAARRKKIEGTVVLQAVVQTDGKARNFQIVKSLESGLDQKAIEAVARWKFRPGMRDGNPVDVLAAFEVNFRLR